MMALLFRIQNLGIIAVPINQAPEQNPLKKIEHEIRLAQAKIDHYAFIEAYHNDVRFYRSQKVEELVSKKKELETKLEFTKLQGTVGQNEAVVSEIQPNIPRLTFS